MGTFGKIDFNLGDGGLGATPTSDDSISALVVPWPKEITNPTMITSYQDALDNSNITETTVLIQFRDTLLINIKQFYTYAANGTKLYISFVDVSSSVPTFSDLADLTKNKGVLDNLMKVSNFTIKQLGLLWQGGAYDSGEIITAIVKTSQVLEGNVEDSVGTINTWAERYANTSPVNVFMFGVDDKTITGLTDLRTKNLRYVSLLAPDLGSKDSITPDFLFGSNNAAYETYSLLGLLLGKVASIPVQENIGWVDAGALRQVSYSVGEATGSPTDKELYLPYTEYFNEAEATIADVVNKGYIIYRRYAGLTGVYWSNGLTLARSTSDYQPLANVRVINKVVRLLREVYLPFIHGDVTLDRAGDLSDGAVGNLSGVGNNVLFAMQQAGEISQGVVEVPKVQPMLLSAQKLDIIVKIIPKAYTAEIVFNVGLTSTLEG